jgi:hypothetical protein
MQDLLSYSNRRTQRHKYLNALKEASKELDNLELQSLTREPVPLGTSQTTLSAEDNAIADTLSKISPSAAMSYEQGLQDLADQERKSWRGTVAEFREALRETLDHLAPDRDVKAQPGFKLEKDRLGPLMKQKVVFILKNRQARSNEIDTAESQVDVIEEKTGVFVRSVYGRSSASTHGVSSRKEAISIKKYVALVLSELLQVPVQ